MAAPHAHTPAPTTPQDLPHTPPLLFMRRTSPRGRVLIWGLWLALAGGMAWLLWAASNPYAGVPVGQVAETATSPVVLEEATVLDRTLQLTGQAYYSFVNYTTGPIEVGGWPLLALALLQVLGWAALLTASTRFESWNAYLLYALLLISFVLKQPGAVLLGGSEPSYVLSGGIAIVLVALAFVFRQRILVWGPAAEFALFTGLLALVYGLGWGFKGRAGLHAITTGDVFAQLVPVVFFILATSRGTLNLILLASLNGPTKAQRRPVTFLLPFMLVVVLLQLSLAAHFYGIINLAPLIIRPLHLFALAGLISMVTLQYVYHQFEAVVPSRLAFCLLILGIGLLGVSSFAYLYSSSELLLARKLERLLALAYGIMGVLYLLYVLVHFWSYLRARVNVYYVLMEPPVATNLRFIVVWFVLLTFVVGLEGFAQWPLMRFARTAFINQRADNALLRGDAQRASEFYRLNNLETSGDPKANYNRAHLLIQQEGSAAEIDSLLGGAELDITFAPARLTLANYYLYKRRDNRALATLQERDRHQQAERPFDALLHNNRAGMFRRLGRADDAVNALKTAIRLAPHRAPLATNMAIIYRENERPDLARSFAEAALEADSRNEYALENALFGWLRNPTDKPPLPERRLAQLGNDTTLPTGLRFNIAQAQLRLGALEPADSTLAKLERQLTPGQVDPYRAYTQAQLGDIDGGTSRMAFTARFAEPLIAPTARAIGYFYFKQGLPEMAAPYYALSAQNGLPQDSLPYAYMLADAGVHEEAITVLDLYRIRHDEQFDELAAEAALLYKAYRQDAFADQVLNFGALRPQQYTRLARYAFTAGNADVGMQALGTYAQQDSSAMEPFVLAGRLFSKAGRHDDAILNLEAGLARDAQHPALHRELALAYLATGQLSKAEASAQFAQAEQPKPARQYLLEATLTATQGDTAAAIAGLQTYLSTTPTYTDGQVLLSDLLRLSGESLAALEQLGTALDVNSNNPELWLAFTRLQLELLNPTEARHGLNQALGLTPNPVKKQLIIDAYGPLVDQLEQQALE